MSDNALVALLVLTLSLAFCGEPDLMDAAIKRITPQEQQIKCSLKTEVE